MTDLLYFLVPWEPSFVVAAITLVTALAYARGVHVAGDSVERQALFCLGFVSLYIVSYTQFDYYAEHEFFMHRIQHTILHHVGPFLIALSRPGAALAAGTPYAIRSEVKAFINLKPISWIIDIFNKPLVAICLFCGLIAFWLLPGIHFIGMMDWRLYRLMNWGMLINGLMFWNLVLNNFCLRRAKLSSSTRILMLIAVIPPQIVIGMLIFAAPHELYPLYSLCGRAYALSPLADQQIGSLILWIPAGMMSVFGALMIMSREWMRRHSF